MANQMLYLDQRHTSIYVSQASSEHKKLNYKLDFKID